MTSESGICTYVSIFFFSRETMLGLSTKFDIAKVTTVWMYETFRNAQHFSIQKLLRYSTKWLSNHCVFLVK